MLLTKEEENTWKKDSRICVFWCTAAEKRKQVEMRKFVKMILADSCHDETNL